MPVSILGINHKTAPVSIREKVAFAPGEIKSALLSLRDKASLHEVAIISTCNRMEIIYRSQENIDENPKANEADSNSESDVLLTSQRRIINWLADHHQIEIEQIDRHSYWHNENQAVEHLMSVACGLDSMVLGEPQVLGQVKDAYAYADHAGTAGLYLSRLFQHTFTLAKQVRTDTQIGESAVSVAYAAVTLSKRIFSDYSKVTALFIGAGETIELAARHLVNQGVVDVHVANRTVERAQKLATEFGGHAYSLSSLPDLIEKADIVISSTASPVPIIGKGLMENVIQARRHRAMFMVDLAVPRDIEAEVASLNDVYLYSVDDMQDVIQENLKLREEAALEAKDIISLHRGKYLSWLKSLSSVSLLKDFRTHIEQFKSQEVSRSIAKLENILAGKENQGQIDKREIEKILSELGNRLTQKFMHQPSRSIRQAGEDNNRKTLEILSDAFGIEKE